MEPVNGKMYSLLYDTKTGDTVMKEVRVDEAPLPATAPKPTKAPTPTEPIGSIVPEAFRVKPNEVTEQVLDAAVDLVVQEGEVDTSRNPHAIARPMFAWQDPSWVSPQEHRKKPIVAPPMFGKNIVKIFREPGKYEEKDTFLI